VIRRCIVLGDGQRVSVSAYVRAVKLAKANPTRWFDRTLCGPFGGDGALIVRQFRQGMHERINTRAVAA
jgi:hypothetical protein